MFLLSISRLKTLCRLSMNVDENGYNIELYEVVNEICKHPSCPEDALVNHMTHYLRHTYNRTEKLGANCVLLEAAQKALFLQRYG